MLKLKRLEEKDLEKVMNWRMQENVTNYMYTNPKLDIVKQRKWFSEIDNDKDMYWIIEFDKKDVGLVSINNIDRKNKRCLWAYYIAEIEFKGKGIARQLECNINDFAFYNLNLNKISSEVFEFNEKVIRIHEKFGAKVEGILEEHIKKNNKYYNVVLLGITEEKWRRKREKLDYIKLEL